MKALRVLQFSVKGYLNFTKPSEPFPEIVGELTNLNYVITGANSGIGL